MDKEDKDTDLKFIRVSDKPRDIIYVFTPNGVEIGHIFMAEEGDYEFWPVLRGGYWPSWGMRQIADYLDSLNMGRKE
jgi:hypothetical protein